MMALPCPAMARRLRLAVGNAPRRVQVGRPVRMVLTSAKMRRRVVIEPLGADADLSGIPEEELIEVEDPQGPGLLARLGLGALVASAVVSARPQSML